MTPKTTEQKKSIDLVNPDMLDLAFIKSIPDREKIAELTEMKSFLFRRKLTPQDIRDMVQNFNEIFGKTMHLNQTCPSFLRAIQIKLRKHYGLS